MKSFDPHLFWKAKPEILDQLQGAPFTGDGYHHFVLQWGREFYEERVHMAGITDGNLVLDAGCGLGQFSAGLSKYNRNVLAFDRSEAMVQTTNMLKKAWSLDNVEVIQAELPAVPFPDRHFDHVWCAGVLMFAGVHASLAEFNRVLKPGGRIYGNINRWARWLLNVARAQAAGKANALKRYIAVLADGNKPDQRFCYLEPSDLEQLAKSLGLRILGMGDEGTVDLSGLGRKRPMFNANLVIDAPGEPTVELPQLLEFVLEKP